MPTSTAKITNHTRLLRTMGGAVLVLSLLASAAGAAQDQAADLQAAARLDSVARLIAGLPPTQADHAELARTKEWTAHARAIQTSWTRVRDGQGAALTAWRNAELPRGCPVGQTLLYPFSGPDYLNAHWLFPDCASLVLFGLERIGDVPAIEGMTRQELAQLLSSVRGFMINLFARNYFVTDTMHKDFRAEQLRGVVPVFMVLIALSGGEVLRVAPLGLKPAASAKPAPARESPATRRRGRELRGVSIHFRTAGSPQVRRLDYFSFDATDAAITAYPEILDHLRALKPTTTLIKAASYLLHGNEFSRLREVIVDTSGFIVQDDTGLPYARLVKRGWQTRVYGNYGIPIPPFEYAYQPALAAAYGKQKPQALPFRFGYQLNVHDTRSNLMVARLPSSVGRPQAGPVR